MGRFDDFMEDESASSDDRQGVSSRCIFSTLLASVEGAFSLSDEDSEKEFDVPSPSCESSKFRNLDGGVDELGLEFASVVVLQLPGLLVGWL